MQRYEEALSVLTRQIFSRQLKAGDKLPTEKQLSEELGIDKTSLRVALKQLESMQLLTIRQGDGMYVKNFMEEAGIDFLRTMFVLQKTENKDWLIDEYILDEIWEFWIAFFPEILRLAATRSSARDIKEALESLDVMVSCIDDREKVVEFNLKIQDLVCKVANNMVITLLLNSFHPLKRIMSEFFINSMDKKEIEEYIKMMRRLIRSVMTASDKDISNIAEQLRKDLTIYREKTRELWKTSATDKDGECDVL